MNNLLNFSKMQALGNDFMVINTINQHLIPNPQQIRRLSDRHLGIGFDQLLIISPSLEPEFDFFYQIFNANGEEVGQCGNGARCAAFYIFKYLKPKKVLHLQTKTTTMHLKIISNHQVELMLPPPELDPQKIPLLGFQQQASYALDTFDIHAISVGNPHAIIVVNDNLEQMDIETIGKHIEHHPAFPERTNVNFMQILNPEMIALRVWERGCGETRACGSGALASAAIARLFYQLHSHIEVKLPGGTLWIDWPDIKGPITLTGPAFESYTGQVSMLFEDQSDLRS